MGDLRKEAVSMLQDVQHNEKRLEEETTLNKNNVAIKDFNKKIGDWGLQISFELTPHNIATLNSKPPYHTINLAPVIQSLIELGDLTITVNPLNLLTNEASALSVSVWEKSRHAVNAFILNYPLVNKDTQNHVDALHETIKATIHTIKHPLEVGAVKTLLEKNNALIKAVESNPFLHKVRAPLYAGKIASLFEKIGQFAACVLFGASIMFCFTCLAPTISIKFATIALISFGALSISSSLKALFSGRRPLPEINDLRNAEDVFAKNVSPTEYHASKSTRPVTPAFSFSGLFKAQATKPEVKLATAAGAATPTPAKA